MKKRKMSSWQLTIMYFAICVLPALLIVAVYIWGKASAFALHDKEAMQLSYGLPMGAIIMVVFYQLIFAEDFDMKMFFASAVAFVALALADLALGYGDVVALILFAVMGIVIAFGTSHHLRDHRSPNWRDIAFVFFTMLSALGFYYAVGLALSEKINILKFLQSL
ncbi:MAG: hypothetical protein WC467_00885 [Patescibacteria group bacterium]